MRVVRPDAPCNFPSASRTCIQTDTFTAGVAPVRCCCGPVRWSSAPSRRLSASHVGEFPSTAITSRGAGSDAKRQRHTFALEFCSKRESRSPSACAASSRKPPKLEPISMSSSGSRPTPPSVAQRASRASRESSGMSAEASLHPTCAKCQRALADACPRHMASRSARSRPRSSTSDSGAAGLLTGARPPSASTAVVVGAVVGAVASHGGGSEDSAICAPRAAHAQGTRVSASTDPH
mmetsp:Transcript_12547/g.29388  ORF Transcript_12547/g.29388 Transcript_12547/m.29388 type:complete len:236 (-) Transcript_12547:72-779(-)|eukprot:CAMPEP_0179842450 /NCGR_PEP_ID=MMETSP0982-20121206/3130_1 /TAXON_ID=483367 /ORGANISM="non described non described, Strain CCMP 2436" /LENGTH=235 /DNA_ID=CAMNT_0021726717 /DNA_START=949 /DNA_END=1656 /DNA_ORIENTATION=+